MVIIDTGSTDRTLEIATSMGARVLEEPWQEDFSLHREGSLAGCIAQPHAVVAQRQNHRAGVRDQAAALSTPTARWSGPTRPASSRAVPELWATYPDGAGWSGVIGGAVVLADGSVLAVGSSTAVSGGTAQAMVLRVSGGGSLLFLRTILPVAKARTLTGIVPAGSDWIVSGHAVENDLYSAELLRLTPAPAKAGVEWAA